MSAKAKGIVKQCLNASKKESEIPITATIPVHKCEPFRTFQNAASVRIPGILLLRVFQGQQYSCLEYRSTETAGHRSMQNGKAAGDGRQNLAEFHAITVRSKERV